MFKAAGSDSERSEQPAADVLMHASMLLKRWFDSIPDNIKLQPLQRALCRIHAAGLLLVPIDRNPGRLVCMCVEAWRALQQSTFLRAPRYKTPDAGRIGLLYKYYSTTVKSSLAQFIYQKTSTTLHWRAPKRACAPFGSWSIKQKSKLQSTPTTIKLRPIIRHHLHPNAPILGRVARAVSLVVRCARTQVQLRIPTHHFGNCIPARVTSSSLCGGSTTLRQ